MMPWGSAIILVEDRLVTADERPGVPGQGGVARQPVQLLDAVLGEEAVLFGTRLDYDSSDRRIAPLRDQLLELVDHRLVEIVVRRIRECGDCHVATLLRSPEIHF